MTPAPKTVHQRLVKDLLYELEAVVRSGIGGRVLGAPCDVYFTETNHVQPDVLYVSKEREPIVTEANVQGAPDLTIEILSESTRKQDELLKRNLYERFGVREYWIVDPTLETVKIYRMEKNGAYGDAEILSVEKGGSIATSVLPGLDLSIAALFGPLRS